jgi:hypothetical protein
MANVKVSWVLPTTRESGKPLAVTDIDSVQIEQSADGGANYVVIDVLPPTVLETTVTDLEPGDWFFRGIVLDKAGRPSKPVTGSISIADNTPPGELTLTLALV